MGFRKALRNLVKREDKLGPLPQQHVLSYRDGVVVSDTRISRVVRDGVLSVSRLDQEASHQQTEPPTAADDRAPKSHVAPLSSQALLGAPEIELESVDHFCGPNAATNQSTHVTASETTNVAEKRAAFLDRQQQQQQQNISVPSTKARSTALARISADHANLLAAADAITGDRVIVLQTIVNIVQKAHEDVKYRRLKSSSKTLQENVLNRGAGPLLAAAGFENRGEMWELSSGASAEHLQTLLSLLDAAHKPLPAF